MSAGNPVNLCVSGSKRLRGLPVLHTIPFESTRMVCVLPPGGASYSVTCLVLGSNRPILFLNCSENHTVPSVQEPLNEYGGHRGWIQESPQARRSSGPTSRFYSRVRYRESTRFHFCRELHSRETSRPLRIRRKQSSWH